MSKLRLVLASASPRRAALLRDAGLTFEVRASDVDERWRPGESPLEYTKRVALDKLLDVSRVAGECRLAADTSVWLDAVKAPYGKPVDRAEAKAMIQRLVEARQHQVTTAYAYDGSDGPTCVAVTTSVHFRRIEAEELDAYLDGGDWQDKAGAYGIQGRAAAFIPRIEGSYTNVVGLPVFEVLQALRARGIVPQPASAANKATS